MSEKNAAATIFDMDRCPICAGTSGFTYKLTIRGTQFQPWNGVDQAAHFEHDDASKHGAYRCDDCGKIIKQKVTPSPSKP